MSLSELYLCESLRGTSVGASGRMRLNLRIIQN